MAREAERQNRQGNWFAAFRDPQWQLETPTTVGSLLRQNPVGPALWLAFLCGFATVVVASQLRLHAAIEVPLGLAAGAAVWWTVMLGFAKGWIADE